MRPSMNPNRKIYKITAVTVVLLMLNQMIFPTAALALTSGAASPETASFEPAGASDMVNLFTGDFTYNIPLMEVEGYPINLSYHGDVGMEHEASWVGLGWNINPGAMTRNMRGLPDDFKGDEVKQTLHQLNQTEDYAKEGNGASVSVPISQIVIGIVTGGAGSEVGKYLNVSASGNASIAHGISQNNYTGTGVDRIIDLSYGATIGLTLPLSYAATDQSIGPGIGVSRSGGLSIVHSSKTGIGINPRESFGINVGLKGTQGNSGTSLGIGGTNSISAQYSTRTGLQQIVNSKGVSVSASISVTPEANNPYDIVQFNYGVGAGTSGSSAISLGTSTYTPYSGFSSYSGGKGQSIHSGTLHLMGNIDLYRTDINSLSSNVLLQEDGTAVVAENSDVELLNKGYGYYYAQETSTKETKGQLMDFNREGQIFHIPQTIPHLPAAHQSYDRFSVTGQGMAASMRPYRNDLGMVFDQRVTNDGISNNSITKISSAKPKLGPGGLIVGTIAAGLAKKIKKLPPEVQHIIDQGGLAMPIHYSKGSGNGKRTSYSGPWLSADGNEAEDQLKFQKDGYGTGYEPAFFRSQGERTPLNQAFYSDMQGSNAVAPKIDLKEKDDLEDSYFKWESKLVKPVHNREYQHHLPTEGYKNKREYRNTNYGALTAAEAASHGLFTTIQDYAPYNGTAGTQTIDQNIARNSGGRADHHLSEMTVTQENGSRYVYGIPVYNHVQKTVSFNTEGNSTIDCQKLTRYEHTVDNSQSNNRGKNHLFQSTEMPGYATSYLLSSILSPDYVDRTGDGPSDDDLGNWTQLNYSQLYEDYAWRYPYSEGDPNDPNFPIAAWEQGYRCREYDDKGNYTYGEKEIWYTHSIVTKNRIAEFYLSDREDGFGVRNEDGQRDNAKPLQKLDKIVLYDRHDREANGANAIPLQTAHFEYDYSLCQGVPNNSGALGTGNEGKLTLQKVWFTYGNSEKGRLSPYTFTYDQAYNYDYSYSAMDRWGSYKPNDCNYPNAEYPYATQDQTLADNYARAWKLSHIDLPSGGSIDVSYEADDYAYVQDKKAMRMFTIEGFGQDENFDPQNINDKLFDGPKANDYIYFKLDEALTGSEAAANILLGKQYMDGVKHLYFRCLTDLLDKGTTYEYVPGYAEVAAYGVVPDPGNTYTHAWVKVKTVRVMDKDEDVPETTPFIGWSLPGTNTNDFTHPFAKAAWQFARLNLSDKLWPPFNCTAGGSSFAQGAIGFLTNQFVGINAGNPFNSSGIRACFKQYAQDNFQLDMATLQLGGLNVALRNKQYGRTVDLSHSFIRLNDPDQDKIGGGYRVTSITSTDGWGSMGGSDMTYGQTYYYTMENSDKEVISSGVAAYEPLIGNNENPWHQPEFYEVENLLAPDDYHYLDIPVGEAIFPAPIVGYRAVKVENLERVNVTRTATGHREYEFYTAKDFPVVTKKTSILSDLLTTDTETTLKLPGLKHIRESKDAHISVEMYGASQGFVVELNDMHGKPKSRSNYDAHGELVNQVRFEYDTQLDETGVTKLNNKVTAYDNNGNKLTGVILGQEVDYTFDSRHSYNSNKSLVKTWNFSVGMGVSISPGKQKQETYNRFASATLTKVISRFGILDKTYVVDGSSTILTQNLAYDYETGQPILTSVWNNYSDQVFGFAYPAYWIYDGMAQAFWNQGLAYEELGINDLVNTTGKFDNGVANGNFTPGDELILQNQSTEAWYPEKYWVLKEQSTGHLYLVDKNGDIPTGVLTDGVQKTYKVLRSGRRNVLGGSAAAFSSLEDPRAASLNAVDKVIAANASEFSDQWEMYCGIDYGDPVPITPGMPTYTSILNFFNELIANGQLESTGLDLSSYPYPNLYAQTYSSYAGCTPWKYMTLANTGSYMAFRFICEPSLGVYNKGSFFIVSPGSYTFSDIAYLSNPVDNSGTVQFTAHMNDGGTRTINTEWPTSEFSTETSCTEPIAQCGELPGNTVNPYYEGIRGTWRPLRSYAYQAPERLEGSNPDIRKDGQHDIIPFWNSTGGWHALYETGHPDNVAAGDTEKWLMTGEITKCDPYGNMLESQDAMGLYSSSVYGYNKTVPVLQAGNARYQEVAYDGFEDYDYYTSACHNGHLNYYTYKGNLNSTYAHTGNYSLFVPAAGDATATRGLTPRSENNPGDDVQYTLKYRDCAGSFSPTTNGVNSKYVVSAWVKEGNTAGTKLSYPDLEIELTADCIPLVPLSEDRTTIIDGWQRVEYVFELPGGAAHQLDITLANNGNTNGYFDDLRIHPFQAAMASYVYEPESMRMLASLDDRNFATFYEYDSEGRLVNTKVETERGIFTVSETRSGIRKN